MSLRFKEQPNFINDITGKVTRTLSDLHTKVSHIQSRYSFRYEYFRVIHSTNLKTRDRYNEGR